MYSIWLPRHRHFEWKWKRKWKMRMHKRLTFRMTRELVNTLYYYRRQPFDTALSRTCDCFGTVLQMVLVVGSWKTNDKFEIAPLKIYFSSSAHTDDRIYTIHKRLAATHIVFIGSIVRSGFRNVVYRLFIVAACGRGVTRDIGTLIYSDACACALARPVAQREIWMKAEKRNVIKSVTNRKTIRWRIDKWSTRCFFLTP